MAADWDEQYLFVWHKCTWHGLKLDQTQRDDFDFCMAKIQEWQDQEDREAEEKDIGYETAGEDDTIGGFVSEIDV
jgi:hypothetical protein